MIDPGDNAHTRWLDSLRPGDPVAHVDGREGTLVRLTDDRALVRIEMHDRWWPIEHLTQPPHPDLLALAARLPEDL